MSLSWSDNGDLYTSASIIKFSAGRRMSQSDIRSNSRHILPEKTLWYVHTLGYTWGIRRPLHIKCQHSSSYYVDKNRCTVEEAGMTVAYSLQPLAVKLVKLPAWTYPTVVLRRSVTWVLKHVKSHACVCLLLNVFGFLPGVRIHLMLRVSHRVRFGGHLCSMVCPTCSPHLIPVISYNQLFSCWK